MLMPAEFSTWDECTQSLRGIIPSAKCLGVDEIDDAAQREGLDIKSRPLPNWADMGDKEILHALMGNGDGELLGHGILLPAICFYGKEMPFLVDQGKIHDFVAGFLRQFGEAFFNGDTIIIFPACKRIYVFHHEGLCLEYLRTLERRTSPTR